eukprot:m.48702 g.48702  ORF g.48702 m.48702 type:complete len:787 (+) comp10580_c0_seq1:329-2689(+)
MCKVRRNVACVTSSLGKLKSKATLAPCKTITLPKAQLESERGFVVKGGNGCIVGAVSPGTQAAEGGLQEGDIIVGVNGKCAVFLHHEDVVALLTDGEAVSLTVLSATPPCKISHEVDHEHLSAVKYDALGFELEENDQTPSTNPQHEQDKEDAWEAFLKTADSASSSDGYALVHNNNNNNESSCNKKLESSPALTALLYNGVPHKMRRQVWFRAVGAANEQATTTLSYEQLVAAAFGEDAVGPKIMSQIVKDLDRTLPHNFFFSSTNSEGTKRLHRVLATTAWTQPHIGYCQGMSQLAAFLLLVMEENEAFWTLRALLRRHYPKDYFSSTLRGAIVDQRVFKCLLEEVEPNISSLFREMRFEGSVVSINWFLTGFCNTAPVGSVLRIWDCFMAEGSRMLHKVGLALTTGNAPVLTNCKDPGEIIQMFTNLPQNMHDADALMALTASFSIVDNKIDSYRAEQRKILLKELEVVQDRRNKRNSSSASISSQDSNLSDNAAFASDSDEVSETSLVEESPILRRRESVSSLNNVSPSRSSSLGPPGSPGGVSSFNQMQLPHVTSNISKMTSQQTLQAGLCTTVFEAVGELRRIYEMICREEEEKDSDECDYDVPVGDDATHPILRVVVDDMLGPALIQVIAHGMKETEGGIPYSNVWNYVTTVVTGQSTLREYKVFSDSSIQQICNLRIRIRERFFRESAADCESENLCDELNPARDLFQELLSIIRWSLNNGVLLAFFEMLVSAASGALRECYEDTAFILSRTTRQVEMELDMLSPLRLNLEVERTTFV